MSNAAYDQNTNMGAEEGGADGSGGASEQERVKGTQEEGNGPPSGEVIGRNAYTEALSDLVTN